MHISKPFAALGLAAALAACAATPPPAPPVVAAAKPVTESLTIDFPTAGYGLTPTAKTQLDGAARLYRDAKPEVMIVSGHTDKVGREFDNLILSARRAELIKRALVDRGVPAERLQIIAVGSAEPLPSSSATRSVVVTWR